MCDRLMQPEKDNNNYLCTVTLYGEAGIHKSPSKSESSGIMSVEMDSENKNF